jgi:hypothetical protein
MPVPIYADFDLLITRGLAGHWARVIHSPTGEASVAFHLPKVTP